MVIRTGNWLSAQQAQTLLSAPGVTTLRERAIIAEFLGCGLGKQETKPD